MDAASLQINRALGLSFSDVKGGPTFDMDPFRLVAGESEEGRGCGGRGGGERKWKNAERKKRKKTILLTAWQIGPLMLCLNTRLNTHRFFRDHCCTAVSRRCTYDFYSSV